jgi:hypothetical protein
METTGTDVRPAGHTGRTTALVWTLRGTWAALALTAATFGEALSDSSRPVQIVSVVGLWTGWALGLLATLVPTATSLTAIRLLAPLAPSLAVMSLVAGGSETLGILALALGLVAAVLAFTGEIGELFVQGSAYGAERRLPLRPPAPLVPALVLMWCLLASAVVAGPLLLAARAWVLGGAVSLLATALVVVLVPRFRLIADRWLVFVPAGLVVHDPHLLAETFMVPATAVVGVSLAAADTEAADVTGNALGYAVEIELRDFDKIVLAADRQNPGGRALHVKSILVSPTRPGRAISAWTAR